MTGSLAERFGTPLYVYQLADLRSAARELRSALPAGTEIYYSLKANPNPGVVRTLIDAGCRAEVCSMRESDVALAAGADAGEALYTGPAKTEEEIDHALRRGIRWFSVDSPTDLARVGARARRHGTTVRAVLRLNPEEYPAGAGLAMGGAPTQFGSDVSIVRAHPDRFRADGVDLVGYHVYVGTNAAPENLASWFDLGLSAMAQAQQALRLDVELVDIGGGFPSPFVRPGERADLGVARAAIAEVFRRRLPEISARPPRVAVESGRFLAGAAGSLIVRVQDVKPSKGTRVVVVDGGINVLGGMQGLRRVPPIMAAATAGDDREPAGEALLAGPLCTALDILNQRLPLADVAPGDLLTVPNVGAYGLTASLSLFLSRPVAAEVCVDGTEVRSAWQLETHYRELAAAEPVPHAADSLRRAMA